MTQHPVGTAPAQCTTEMPDIDTPLKSTQWLAAELHSPDLRVFDCTSFFLQEPGGGVRVESGRAQWAQGHIPGANHIALQDDISDPSSGLRFTMPPAPVFAARMAALGVDDRSTVVLYASGHYMWATRVWWMLKEIGFDRAYVLDGGFEKWQREGRPISTDAAIYPPGRLTPSASRALFADRHAMLAAIDDPAATLVNALPPGQFRGDPGQPHHGRPGRIPESINVPALSLLTAEGTMRPTDELAAILSSAGAHPQQTMLCYCGGGVSATCVALAMTIAGYPSIQVYDGSMNEWATDASLPMVRG